MSHTDSEIVAWPDDIPVPLVQHRRSIEPRSETTTFMSHRKRTRRIYSDPVELLDVRWNFTEDLHNAFRDFFEASLNQGVDPFEMTTYEPSTTEGMVYEVVRICAFVDGLYKLTRSDNLFAVTATLIVEAEERDLVRDPILGPEPPPEQPVSDPPVIEYTSCYDEITISWTGLTEATGDVTTDPNILHIRNVTIWHSDAENGTYLFWGETRRPASQVKLSNYFKTRWIKVFAENLLGTILVAHFKPTPPNVDPPMVKVEQQTRGSFDPWVVVGNGAQPTGYEGGLPASPYRQYRMPFQADAYTALDTGLPDPKAPSDPTAYATWPYGYGGFSFDDNPGASLTKLARDEISAVYEGNADGNFRIALFSDAFVEVSMRRQPLLFSGVNSPTGKRVRIVHVPSPTQPDAEFRFTFDGTDPTLLDGLTSSTIIDPAQIDDTVPFVPYVICRCFKDGCHSPPIYIPIDVVMPQLNAFAAWSGVGGSVFYSPCAAFYRHTDDVDPGPGVELVTTTDQWSAGLDPCAINSGLVLQQLLLTSCAGAGSAPPSYNTGHLLRNFDCSLGLGFYTRDGIDNYYGEDTGEDGIFGGGAYAANCEATIVRAFTYSRDTWFDYKPAEAYYLISGAANNNDPGASAEDSDMPFPLPGESRSEVVNLYNGALTNNAASILYSSLHPQAKSCPPLGVTSYLTDVTIVITCANG